MVLIVIGMLVAFLVPMLRAAKQRSYGLQCADHLRQIGQAMLIYMDDNRGEYPRTRASDAEVGKPTWGTGAAAADPFGPEGAKDDDVTAGPFLLIRAKLVEPTVFVCPSTDEVADNFAAHARGALGRSNFTSVKRNLSYSFHNVYPDRRAAAANWEVYRSAPDARVALAQTAYAADKNPGLRGPVDDPERDDVRKPAMEAPSDVMRLGNSANHNKTGQNVLYFDGHVAWTDNPLCGWGDDNIFIRAATIAGGASDLADPFGSPVDIADSVLLPTDD